jgi:hypothetical protein
MTARTRRCPGCRLTLIDYRAKQCRVCTNKARALPPERYRCACGGAKSSNSARCAPCARRLRHQRGWNRPVAVVIQLRPRCACGSGLPQVRGGVCVMCQEPEPVPSIDWYAVARRERV